MDTVTSILEDTMAHFIPYHKAWAEYGRTWCMIRQGREVISMWISISVLSEIIVITIFIGNQKVPIV